MSLSLIFRLKSLQHILLYVGPYITIIVFVYLLIVIQVLKFWLRSNCKPAYINQIKDFLSEHHFYYWISWIKVHSGEYFNDIKDHFTKIMAYCSEIVNIPAPISLLRKLLLITFIILGLSIGGNEELSSSSLRIKQYILILRPTLFILINV